MTHVLGRQSSCVQAGSVGSQEKRLSWVSFLAFTFLCLFFFFPCCHFPNHSQNLLKET